MTSHYRFFATAPKYTETLLLQELRQLGAEDATETVGGVNFSGELQLAYRICLWSRIANRILLALKKARIGSVEDLYDAVYEINWADHFSEHETFAIDFFANQSVIQHTQFGAQKCKDAIVDQFRQACGQRPSVDKANPDIRINVHVNKNAATISLDLSGHSLHQRGYRRHSVSAPLKENLAAALLMRARWPEAVRQNHTFVDPLCGSGTLLIEAACMAANIAPGLFRTDFGFDAWQHHDEKLWSSLRREAQQSRNNESQRVPRIIGFDREQAAVSAAKENIALAGLDHLIEVHQQAVTDLTNDGYGEQGLLVTNAPYGERLGDNASLIPLYETLGKKLRQHFIGWTASIMTSDPSLAKATGLYAARRNKLYNGKLLCQIYHFRIDDNAKRINKPHSTGLKTERKPELAHETDIDSALQNRLTKNLKQLRKWADKNGIDCYRIYDADLPEYNFAIDVYHSDKTYVVLQEYAAPPGIDAKKISHRSDVTLSTAIRVLEVPRSQVFYKQRARQPGSKQYEKIADSKQFHVVREYNCNFYVNFTDYLDTGLFLDHRDTRQMIQRKASNKTFLNLFCYTGTASVHAAIGGAQSTTSVDLSTTYIDWCKRNFALNELPLERHHFIKADCLQWLEQENNRYQLIFVDPPTFSNSKMMDEHFDIQKHHANLLRQCLALLDTGGEIVFSTNYRKFRFEEHAFSDCIVENISAKTLPRDFARNPKIHQCWVIRKA